ncbi:MAG: hypothetical protein NT166_08715 [Candidatus Aminicenantes bacterium]|nr:hypothetical protein [Candidatus Aminicenantes bacterium]
MTDNKKLFIIQWLIIVVFSVLIGLLILQNVSLKKSFPTPINNNCDSYIFESRLGDHFLDTPFFIYTSHTFKVLDIFKPKYMDNKGLETWLRIVTDQEIF